MTRSPIELFWTAKKEIWKNLESGDFCWNSQMMDCNQCPVVCWQEVFAWHTEDAVNHSIFWAQSFTQTRRHYWSAQESGNWGKTLFSLCSTPQCLKSCPGSLNIANTTQDSPPQSTRACCMSWVHKHHMTQFTRCHKRPWELHPHLQIWQPIINLYKEILHLKVKCEVNHSDLVAVKEYNTICMGRTLNKNVFLK